MDKNKMNKTIIIILITIIVFLTILITLFIKHFNINEKKQIEFETTIASINEIYIYGTHLNIKGSLDIPNLTSEEKIKKFEIITLNSQQDEFLIDTLYQIEDNKIKFMLSDKINDGLYLDNFKIDKYNFIGKITISKNDKTTYKYYYLKNDTNYKNTKYYTINNNKNVNKITFNDSDEELKTLTMNVEKNTDDNIYDITIDAGHGGKDPGACYNGKCETDYTLILAKKLKESLEQEGLKVNLTRDTNDGVFPTYGSDGRVAIPQNSNSKYLFSFHLNAGNYDWNGVEIYCPLNSNNTLASDIATYITAYTGTNFSNKIPYNIGNGIYTRPFKQNEINSFYEEIDAEGYERYHIDSNTNYYYLIRETGGYMTGAYTDGRDGSLYNPYVLSNRGVESYIMEIGYISSLKDLENINNNLDKYVEAIKQAIINNIYK